MNNKGKHYAGQPYMISMWEHMWHRIYTRLDDECDRIEERGKRPSQELLARTGKALIQLETLEAMLDEAHQLQNNVARMTDQIQWKFNLVVKDKFNG